MKKFLLALALLVPALGFVSCDDDGDDLPDVKFSVTYSNPIASDGVLYVAQGDTIKVDSINIRNMEAKTAIISNASYYFDYLYVGTAVQPPFGGEIIVSPAVPVGDHVLEIVCPVYAVDKAPAVAQLYYPVKVVQSKEDIPQGSATVISTPQIKEYTK